MALGILVALVIFVGLLIVYFAKEGANERDGEFIRLERAGANIPPIPKVI